METFAAKMEDLCAVDVGNPKQVEPTSMIKDVLQHVSPVLFLPCWKMLNVVLDDDWTW